MRAFISILLCFALLLNSCTPPPPNSPAPMNRPEAKAAVVVGSNLLGLFGGTLKGIAGFAHWECSLEAPYAYARVTDPQGELRGRFEVSDDGRVWFTPDSTFVLTVVHEMIHLEQMYRLGGCEEWATAWLVPGWGDVAEAEAYCRSARLVYGVDHEPYCSIWQEARQKR